MELQVANGHRDKDNKHLALGHEFKNVQLIPEASESSMCRP